MRAAVIAAGICLSMISPCFGQASTTTKPRVETRIPPQALGSALKQFEKIDHIYVLYIQQDVDGVRTPGASGELTADETLTNLLKGTGLTYHYIDRNSISIIRSADDEPKSDSPMRAPPSSNEATRPNSLARTPQENSRPMNDPTSGTPDPPALNPKRTESREGIALQEVIVTAQKFRQRAFDVPISLDVVSGQEVQRQGITNVADLQFAVPGLVVDGGQNAHRIYLQGIGNSYGNGSLVGEYIDEADVTSVALSGQSGLGSTEAALYDISRVEVLRGPQGTLYGDGSMGGVIRYITNAPQLTNVDMSANIAAGLTQYGAPSERVEGMVNAPIVRGILGLRFAGMLEHDGGWVDQPAASLKNINTNDVVDVRVEGLWEPIENLKINAMQTVHRNGFGIGYDETDNGSIPEVYGLTSPPHSQVNFNLSNVTISRTFADVRVLNSATYFTTTQNQYNLFDIEQESPARGSVTFWYLSPYTSVANVDYSDELRLSNFGKGAWRWTIGGFYKQFRDDELSDSYSGLPGPLSSAYHELYGRTDISNSLAGFLNTSYVLLSRLTVGAGARYFKDHETAGSTGVAIQGATFTSTDPRFFIQYHISPHVNAYATASKGFRSGGFNSPGELPYAPETVWTYDVGAKFRYPQSSLTAAASYFYTKYSNYVVVGYFPPQFRLANAGTAKIVGADASIAWRLNARWQVRLNGELLNSRFVSISGGPYAGFEVGNRLPFAPTYSFTASLEHNFSFAGKPGSTNLYYYEISRTQFREYGFNLAESNIPHLFNLRIGLQWSRHLSFGILATNLLNDRESLSPLVAVTGESMRPQPRTLWFRFGVTHN